MKKNWTLYKLGIIPNIIIVIIGVLVAWYLKDIPFTAFNEDNTRITVLFFIFVIVLFGISGSRFLKAKTEFNKLVFFKHNLEKTEKFNIEAIKEWTNDEKSAFSKAFKSYYKDCIDVRKTSKEAIPDISNYISYDLIDEVIWTHYQNQIGGIMTGLGILGTFLGLSIGLKDFDLSDEQSILTLMDGIKVAFHTSIYGIIYSLLFNLVYRRCLKEYHDGIDDFVNAFEKKVANNTLNGSPETFIKYNEQVISLLTKQFDVSQKMYSEYSNVASKQIDSNDQMLVLQNRMDERIGELSTTITKDFSDVLKELVVPELQKFSTSIDNFTAATNDKLVEGLREIIDVFITNMNESLGDSFKELGKIIEDTNSWQRKSLDEMQSVVDILCDTSKDLGNISATITDAAQKTQEYAVSVNDMEKLIETNMDSLKKQIDENNSCITSQVSLLDQIKNNEVQVVSATEKFAGDISSKFEQIQTNENALLVAIQESLANIIEGNGKVDSAIENKLQILKDLYEKYLSSAKENSETFANEIRTLFEEYVSEANNLTQSSTEDIRAGYNNVTEGIQSNLKVIGTLSQKMESSMSSDATTYADNLKSMFDEYISSSSELIRSGNDDIRDSYNKTVEDIRTNLDALAGLETNLTDGLTTAANSMTDATEKLGQGMDKRIDETFAAFDSELTEIVKHLSGTLLNMKEVINKVPEFTADSYNNMTEILNEMQVKLEQYLEYADKLYHNMETKWNQYTEANKKGNS